MTTILIVDDNSQNLYLLDVLLKTNGYSVDQASNGIEALNAAHLNPPDMIITDILMPTMDGFSLCRAFKKDEVLKHIPFVFYTATYTDPKDEEFALSLGADRFVVKPQMPDVLLGIIRDVLEKMQNEKEHLLPKTDGEEESDYYKGYNEALVRKLEKKMLQLEKSNKRLLSFYQVTHDLITIRSSKDIIHRVLQAIYEIIGYQKIIYFDNARGSAAIQISEAMGIPDSGIMKVNELLASPSSETHIFARMVIDNRKPIYIEDTSLEERWVVIDPTIRSALFIPVQYENQCLGVIGLFSSEKSAFDEDEMNIVTLANSLAISMVNKRAEEEIIRMNLELEDKILERTTQLQSSNRDLEAFAYSVSHDLRAPLRAIEGYSALLLENHTKQLDEEGSRILELVCQNTQKMDTFITDLLSLSKMSLTEKKYVTIKMEKIISEVVSEISKNKRNKNLSFHISELPEVFADPVLMQQVWTNLIQNAVKYSELRDQPVIKISCESKSSENVFLVEDNGIGFNQNVAQNLFQPFQRLYQGDEYEGTGVGLTIVKRIVERHGGRVWAEGRQNEWARFYFSLPKQA